MWIHCLVWALTVQAQILLTRDWGNVPELGSAWNPRTHAWSPPSTGLEFRITETGESSVQLGCIESKSLEEITSWLQGTNVFFTRQDLEYVVEMFRQKRSMAFCYGVKTHEAKWLNHLRLKEKADQNSLPSEIVVASRQQNLTLLAWDLDRASGEIWVISTLPRALLQTGLWHLSRQLQIQNVLTQLREWALDPCGDKVCWLETRSLESALLQTKWANHQERSGTSFPNI